MKTKIIILLSLITNIVIAQLCPHDSIPLYGEYNYMEVYDHKAGKYEKYNRVNAVKALVVIDSEHKTITFQDEGNSYYKKYTILNCMIGLSSFMYECFDIANNRKCEFRFSEDKSLTVTYQCEPVIYRVKNIK
jgi:hypothetical protein